MDGRGGKHAGQKRTYRAIAETYSFLPREAVTRFLMSCTDCQKRMHLSLEGNNNTSSATNQNESSASPVVLTASAAAVASEESTSTPLPSTHHLSSAAQSDPPPPIIDFSVPITQTILNHMRNKGYMSDYSCHDEESMSSADSDMSTETSPSTHTESALPSNDSGKDSLPFSDRPFSTPLNMAAITQTTEMADSACSQSPRNAVTPNKSPTPDKVISESRGHPERKRRASNESEDSAVTKTSESGAVDDLAGSKDEDDDDNDDDDEKGPPGQNYDPERLKAFNMFVRLFVDENLDRVVPISKQPKDKIQAILEACDRQFPEFHERSRKRIRTYLKSCRRMRRSKEQNGWEPQLRPTPPHLTSAAAEGILAAACENESQNAKRMRMGMEPLPATIMNAARELGGNAATLLPAPPLPPTVTATPTTTNPPQAATTPTPQQQTTSSSTSSTTTLASQQTSNSTTPNSLLADRPNSVAVGVATSDFLRGHTQPPPPPVFRAAPGADFPPFLANGNGLFRPSAAAAGFTYQHPAHHHPPTPTPSLLQQQQQQQHPPRLSGSGITNGDFVPTDLSMKKSSSKNQLSATEVTTIKQLIAGYRESAAFLYRSADELEQLLLQQN